MLNNLLKFFDNFFKNRKTREKVIIKTFAKVNVDLDYANRWNATLFKKKNILITNFFYLIVNKYAKDFNYNWNNFITYRFIISLY